MNKRELKHQLNLSENAYRDILKNGFPSIQGDGKEFDFNKVVKWIDKKNNEIVEKLTLGEEYSNQEIVDIFGCAPQGGMRRSVPNHALVLFTDHTGKSVYEDKWSENILHYTGMGQKGDQNIEGSQNKVLANTEKNLVKGYLFETHESKKHTYSGQVELVDEPYTMIEKGDDGIERIVYKFPLKLIDEPVSIDEEKVKITIEKKRRQTKKLSLSDLKKKADMISVRNKKIDKELRKSGDHFEGYRFIKKKEYDRDPAIAEYVKKIANGICQLCDQQAPFEKNGIPFLHSHHINYLSEGGLDTVDNSIAVCPNCHARIHELELKTDRKKMLNKVFER